MGLNCQFHKNEPLILRFMEILTDYFPIQYLTILMSIDVKAFGQQIGCKKYIKRINKE